MLALLLPLAVFARTQDNPYRVADAAWGELPQRPYIRVHKRGAPGA